jgi:hypothetical protein
MNAQSLTLHAIPAAVHVLLCRRHCCCLLLLLLLICRHSIHKAGLANGGTQTVPVLATRVHSPAAGQCTTASCKVQGSKLMIRGFHPGQSKFTTPKKTTVVCAVGVKALTLCCCTNRLYGTPTTATMAYSSHVCCTEQRCSTVGLKLMTLSGPTINSPCALCDYV